MTKHKSERIQPKFKFSIRLSGKSLQRIGAALGGFWIASLGLNLLWPEIDHISYQNIQHSSRVNKGILPKKDINILIIGTNENKYVKEKTTIDQIVSTDVDSLIILGIKADEPSIVVQIPTEIGIRLPGENKVKRFSQLYSEGGIALTKDVISEVIGIPNDSIHRYILISHTAIKTLINAVGGLEITLKEPLQSTYRVRGYVLSLPKGKQILNAEQVLQLIKYRDDIYDNRGRRKRRSLVYKAFIKKLNNPKVLAKLPDLLQIILTSTKTNLTYQELLSLAEASLTSNKETIFTQIPLTQETKNQIIREPDPALINRFWIKEL